jgi:hypothetical protein
MVRCDLSFGILKSKIKKFSPATTREVGGCCGGPSLKRTGFEPFKDLFGKQRENISSFNALYGNCRVIDALQNGENRSSLASSVLELFEKWPRPFFF